MSLAERIVLHPEDVTIRDATPAEAAYRIPAPPARKFDESEARDDAGRWTAGGGGSLPAPATWEGVQIPAMARYGLPGAVQTWRQNADGVRKPSGPADYRQAFVAARDRLTTALARQGSSAPVLWRGLRTPIDEAGEYRTDVSIRKEFPVGKTVDLGLTSFASSRADAEIFSDGDETPERVLIELDPGARALDIGESRFPGTFSSMDDHEWLTAGRFAVTSVETVPDWLAGDGEKSGDSYLVHLRQAEPLTIKIALADLHPSPILDGLLGGHSEHRPRGGTT